ncbi:MAG TPA: hypothetical protein VME23_07910 [Terracidiphilus sp.]|nr:hypothetical protein [Terracidiphilus sp.]
MAGLAASKKRFNPGYQLTALALLMVAMYECMRTLRFTNDWLNLAFEGLFLLIPLLAIAVASRLSRRAKVWTLVFLTPVGLLSLGGILIFATSEIPVVAEQRQLSQELGTVRQGRYSVHLVWEETAGGVLGPHGVGLEQRVFIAPGLYVVKFLDYFDGEHEGSLEAVGDHKIMVHIPTISGHDKVDRVYSLKPWVYF